MKDFKGIGISGDMMADIISGFGVPVDPKILKDRFENKVLTMLKNIEKNHVGSSLIAEISKYPGTVWINPYFPPAGFQLKNATASSAQFDVQIHGKDDLASIININPETWEICDAGCDHLGTAGSASDEILFHEMVHSYRQITGKITDGMSPGLPYKFSNDEEFIAVVLTNIYMASKGKSLLRNNHSGFAANSPLLLDTMTTEPYKSILNNFKRDHGSLVSRLNASQIYYNPFAYIDHIERGVAYPNHVMR